MSGLQWLNPGLIAILALTAATLALLNAVLGNRRKALQEERPHQLRMSLSLVDVEVSKKDAVLKAISEYIDATFDHKHLIPLMSAHYRTYYIAFFALVLFLISNGLANLFEPMSSALAKLATPIVLPQNIQTLWSDVTNVPGFVNLGIAFAVIANFLLALKDAVNANAGRYFSAIIYPRDR